MIDKDYNSESGSQIIVPVYIKDSEGQPSAVYDCEIYINAVNDRPSFSNLNDIFISEEETYEELWAFDIFTGADNEDQDLTFIIEFDDLVNSFEFLENGQLIINPIENANGSATFNVYLEDSEGGQSETVSYTLSIEPVNDPPIFDYIESKVIDEDQEEVVLFNWAFNINPGGGNGPYVESDQVLEFIIEEYDPIFFDESPLVLLDDNLDWFLKFKVNENVNGETIIKIKLQDNGDNKLDDNYTENNGYNISEVIDFSVQVNQINDLPAQFSLFSDLRNYQEDESKFYTSDEDESIYFRYPYQSIYIEELNNPEKLRFEWEWVDSLDIDIYDNINQDVVMNNIYYRLEAVESENPSNIIILADSLIYNSSNPDINYEVDNENNIVRIDLDLTTIENLDLSGNTSYHWRVLAQNYQEDYQNSDPEFISENIDYSFFIDLTLPTLDIVPFFDDIFLEYFDLYMLGSERFFDFNFNEDNDNPNRPIKLWLDYGNDGSDEQILFPEEIDELNYIYFLNHDFTNSGDIKLNCQMRDKVENINQNSEIISVKAIDPNYNSEIGFLNQTITLSIPKNSTNTPINCLVKSIDFLDTSINSNRIGDIIKFYPDNLSLNNKVNLSFNLKRLNTNYEFSNLAIYKLENNDWILCDSYIINDLLYTDINQFGTFAVFYNEAHNTPILFPDEYSLNQNYPNPFNPSTTIEYYLPYNNYVELNIYNIKGQQVKSLYKGYLEAGYHSIIWNGQSDSGVSLASGIYIVSFKHGKNVIRNKMVKIK